MQHARKNVFAGATLAFNQDRHIQSSSFFHPTTQCLHACGATEDDRAGRQMIWSLVDVSWNVLKRSAHDNHARIVERDLHA